MAVLENGFPFDNMEYDATALGAWLSTRTRGVFSDDEHYAVTAIGGMQVSVSSGIAWLKMNEQWGMVAPNPATITLSVDVGDTILNRIDVACLRIDKNQSVEEVVIKKGELAATPAYPTLVRDLNYDEVYLAAISVPAGTTELSAALITDLRGNETYCGVMRDGVTGIPTAQLQAQAEALIELLEDAIAGVIDGSQYMLKAGYDQDNTVADAGGIAPYVDSQLANKANNRCLEVITGATPPSTAAEGAIYVPNDVSVVSYCKETPLWPIDGELWVPEENLLQVRSRALLDALLPVGSPRLYSGSAWQMVEGALIMQDGEWVNFIDAGNIYENGFWVKEYNTFHSVSGTYPLYTDNNEYFSIANTTDSRWTVQTVGFDASKYSTICIEATTRAGGGTFARIGYSLTPWSGSSSTPTAFEYLAANTARSIYTLDISNVSSTIYPTLEINFGADVYKWWLE